MSCPHGDPKGFHMELAKQSLAAWMESFKEEFILDTVNRMEAEGIHDPDMETSLRKLLERYQDQSTWRLVSYVEHLHRKGVDFSPAFLPRDTLKSN